MIKIIRTLFIVLTTIILIPTFLIYILKSSIKNAWTISDTFAKHIDGKR